MFGGRAGSSWVGARVRLNFNLPTTQLAPNAGQMPAILAVANKAAQMQPRTTEASQTNAGGGEVLQREAPPPVKQPFCDPPASAEPTMA
jgi:hypothetical protein